MRGRSRRDDGAGLLDMMSTGLGSGDLAALTEYRAVRAADPDAAPGLPEHPIVRAGDIWLLGDHRIACGDSTDPATVRGMLGTDKPHLMVTDPPYGVNYTPDWRNEAGRALDGTTQRIKTGTVVRPISIRSAGIVLNDSNADWSAAWRLFPGDVAYVWHADKFASIVHKSLESVGLIVRSQIIWNKSRFVIGRGDYHFKHEPCQPAGTMVTKVIDPGSGSQTSSFEDVPIETIKNGDRVVSFTARLPGGSKIFRRGRVVNEIGSREYSGNLYTINVGGRSTKATAEHQFTIRFNRDASNKYVMYLMRRDFRWRVGVTKVFGSLGFGPMEGCALKVEMQCGYSLSMKLFLRLTLLNNSSAACMEFLQLIGE